jgi:hypothetical protein
MALTMNVRTPGTAPTRSSALPKYAGQPKIRSSDAAGHWQSCGAAAAGGHNHRKRKSSNVVALQRKYAQRSSLDRRKSLSSASLRGRGCHSSCLGRVSRLAAVASWRNPLPLTTFWLRSAAMNPDENRLQHGPIGGHCAHICVDMQRLFAHDTPWRIPWLERVLPQVVDLVGQQPERTIFTRFFPAARPGDGVVATLL